MHSLKSLVRSFVPPYLLSAYHFALACLGALFYRFPSRRLTVIGVTGTNGKTSTTEYLNSIFEAAGRRVALSNSIRMKIGDVSLPGNGRSMPGRFFIQRLMRRALANGCTVAIIEMTSEGVKQHRHRFIALDCLVFTNLAPEHIESHGSYQAYADAKFAIARALERSRKRPRVIVANADDAEGARYLSLPVEKTIGFSLRRAEGWRTGASGGVLRFADTDIAVRFPGELYLKNALAAAEVARAFGISVAAIRTGIECVSHIPGRLQKIDEGQDFSVIVDYALTPDALEALYNIYGEWKKICVFGSAGGGRDTWKRPVLGKIAERYCEKVILTNDIAYDEPAERILEDIAKGMQQKPEIIQDRRLAIRRALEHASASHEPKRTAVLITGMGIDTEITGPDGRTHPWSDVEVAREELKRLGGAL